MSHTNRSQSFSFAASAVVLSLLLVACGSTPAAEAVDADAHGVSEVGSSDGGDGQQQGDMGMADAEVAVPAACLGEGGQPGCCFQDEAGAWTACADAPACGYACPCPDGYVSVAGDEPWKCSCRALWVPPCEPTQVATAGEQCPSDALAHTCWNADQFPLAEFCSDCPCGAVEPVRACGWAPEGPCQSHDQCSSGWCLTGPHGPACAKSCVESCPEGFECAVPEDASPGYEGRVCVWTGRQ